ncbi:uncharacterized protein LOC142631758 [Castanea sativa]|uniref:uncharacterized protein LOC142631758 n=1 Tax=Castanea sativa TaxID=21020 RepID=UPI003F64BBB7
MNNEAEYEALLVGITIVRKMGGKTVKAFSDLKLVMGQVKGELKAKDVRMQGYLSQAWRLHSGFNSFTIQQIPRSRNKHADSLATLATSSGQNLPRVILVKDLDRHIKEENGKVQVHQIKVRPSWMDPIVLILKEGVLPHESREVEKHGGVLNPLSSSWSFTKWGLDIVRHFLKAVGNQRWLLVGMNYFKKWVETKPLSNIRDVDAKKFVWKNIVTRFEIPHALISDNGLQIDSKAFRRYCCELGIENRYSTPAYSQGNGQAEAVNKVIVNGLKKRTSLFTPNNNDRLLERSLDLVNERREAAMVQLVHYQQKLKQGYDTGVRARPLAPSDLVLKKVVGTAKNPS